VRELLSQRAAEPAHAHKRARVDDDSSDSSHHSAQSTSARIAPPSTSSSAWPASQRVRAVHTVSHTVSVLGRLERRVWLRMPARGGVWQTLVLRDVDGACGCARCGRSVLLTRTRYTGIDRCAFTIPAPGALLRTDTTQQQQQQQQLACACVLPVVGDIVRIDGVRPLTPHADAERAMAFEAAGLSTARAGAHAALCADACFASVCVVRMRDVGAHTTTTRTVRTETRAPPLLLSFSDDGNTCANARARVCVCLRCAVRDVVCRH
jgi:hypothetical protein